MPTMIPLSHRYNRHNLNNNECVLCVVRARKPNAICQA